MNTSKKASIVIELLVLLIVVVLTSAGILLLVKFGVLTVKAETKEVPLLNTEFLPYGREGTLVIKEFQFCRSVDKAYHCLEPKETFNSGDEVHFHFVVESTPLNGELMLVENYQIKGPEGNILLEVDEKNNYYFDVFSKNKIELVQFKDYFLVGEKDPPGEYTLNLIIENPLLNKKSTLTKKLQVQ